MTTPDSHSRRFHPTPGRLLAFLLVFESILFLLNWLQWTPKGWSVLFAIAAVAVVMTIMFFWYLFALFYHCRFQFSIRSILVLTLAVAIPSSWLAVEMEQAKRQREKIEPLMKWGGVFYDFVADWDGSVAKWPKLPPPTRLANLLGDDFFGDLTCIDLSYSKISDDDLKNLEGIKLSPALWLKETQITDAGLEYLKGLSQLKLLVLSDSIYFTDAGLNHFKGLEQLRILYLNRTAITDKGLKNLLDLKQLKFLCLSETQINGTGVKQLKRLENLIHIDLQGTQITDDALACFEGFKRLKWLELGKTRITDTGLKHLKVMPQLITLEIDENDITDAGLVELECLENLRNLSVNNTQVTEAGVAKFHEVKSKCIVEHYGCPPDKSPPYRNY